MEYEGITLNDGEEVVCKIVKNPLAALGGVIWFVFFLIIGIVVYASTGAFAPPAEPNEYGYANNGLRTVGLTYGSLLIFIGVIILVCVLLSLAHVKLILTNKRVIGTRGVFARDNIDIPLSKIDAVSVKRSFFGSIFGYQSVQVFSPSTATISRKGSMFGYAKNATEFKNAVVQEIDKFEKREQAV